MNALHGKGALFQRHQPKLVAVTKVRRGLARPEGLGLARRVGGVEQLLACNDLLTIRFSIYTPIIGQQQAQLGPAHPFRRWRKQTFSLLANACP